MSEVYSKWHQRNFYDHGDEIRDAVRDITGKPFYITEEIMMEKYSGSQMRFSQIPVPGNDELMILSILLTCKTLSVDQLRCFLMMKGRSIGRAAIIKILKKLVTESIAEEYVISRKIKDAERQEKKKEELRLYKAGRTGYYIGEQMGIKPYSQRRLYEIRNRYRSQMVHLLTDYTWNQIVLENLVENGGMKWFSVDEVRFVNESRPIFIPLTIQTEGGTYIYEYIETGYDWETAEVIKKYEEYAKASGRIFTLVLVMQRDHLYPLRSIRKVSEMETIDIAFTSVAEWYSENGGNVFRICAVS